MRYLNVITMGIAVVLISFSLAFASGDIERGKKLFNDPALGGSTNSSSCNSCHSNGSGLEKAGTKTYSSFMGLKAQTLEDIVNICIEKPLKGKALAADSPEMQDLVAYIRSLGGK